MKRLKPQQWLIIVTFVIVAALTGGIAVRTARRAIYWHRHIDEPIQAWMTLSHVAHSYHVPPSLLFDALGIPYKPPDRRPITKIALDQHRPIKQIIAVLQEAIAHARSPLPPAAPAPDSTELR